MLYNTHLIGKIEKSLIVISSAEKPVCKGIIAVKRNSDTVDRIPFYAHDRRLFDSISTWSDSYVEIYGSIRTKSIIDAEGKKHKKTAIKVEDIKALSEQTFLNSIEAYGTLVYTSSVRTTPLGKRICDAALAIDYKGEGSAYVNIIAWGSVAERLSHEKVGNYLRISGRVQSRIYTKKSEDYAIPHSVIEISLANYKECLSIDTCCN